MFTNDFNPFEVLERDEVKRDFNDIIEKVRKKESFNYGKKAANVAIMHLAHLSVAWVNALGMINEWQNKKELNKIHIAQLIYLEKHPEDLKKVVEANMAVCTIILYHSYSISQVGGNVTDALNMFWCALKNLSLDKGFEESQQAVYKRREKNMWNILLSPIALLMNQKYVIGKNKTLCDNILADIVEEGSRHSDVDSLCTETIFTSFMKTTIFEYFKNDKYSYKRYMDMQFGKDACGTIDSHIDFFLSNIQQSDRIYL